MATLNSIEIPSIASGTYKSLTLQTAGTWFIKPRCQKYTLTGRLSEGADSLISQEGVGLNVKVSQADAPLTIYLQADCEENVTAKADYSDCFFESGAEGEGGGGGGTTYSFSAPLKATGGNVSLNLANDLQVSSEKLTLAITNNSDFQNLQTSVQTLNREAVKLTGNQSIGGNKVFTSNLEIDANGEVLKLKNTSNTSNYIAGYEGNTRIYYIGKESYNSTDLSIKNDTANGWITLKTKSKFDQAYPITSNEQIVHKKYVDDSINNCVKLTGDQSIAGEKTFSGFSHFNNFVDVNVSPSSTYPFMLRFIGDRWANNQSADLIRFHKYGAACGYKVYVNSVGGFGHAELWGLTLISNMKDPTADDHGANKRYVDSKTGNLSQLSTTAKGNLVESINEVNDNMPVVLPAGTQPTTSNVGSMKVAFVLK